MALLKMYEVLSKRVKRNEDSEIVVVRDKIQILKSRYKDLNSNFCFNDGYGKNL